MDNVETDSNRIKAKSIIDNWTKTELEEYKAIFRKKGYLCETESEIITAYVSTYMGLNGCVSVVAAIFAIGAILFGLYVIFAG